MVWARSLTWGTLGFLLASVVGCASSSEAKASPDVRPNKAEPFEITDYNGQVRTLSKLTAEGPLVLVFLRGFG